MTPSRRYSGNGIPRWSSPWAALWTSMQEGERARQPHTLPKDPHIRTHQIGVRAIGAASIKDLLLASMMWGNTAGCVGIVALTMMKRHRYGWRRLRSGATRSSARLTT